MTDEHPEQLLERALAGHLDAAERAALDLHLTACLACRLRLALATQIRNGEAAARDEALNRLAITGALARLKAPPGGATWRIGRISLRLAAAGVLLFAGLAVAAAVSFRAARTPRAAGEGTQVGMPPMKTRSPGSPVPVATTATPSLSLPTVNELAPEPSVTSPPDAPASTR